jgi:hypothetical protein
MALLKEEVSSRRLLEELTAEVRHSADSLKSLQQQVAVVQSRGAARRRVEREVSEQLLGELEQRSRAQQKRAEEEVRFRYTESCTVTRTTPLTLVHSYTHTPQVGRLHGLLAAVEKSIRQLRSQSVEERERLRGEQTRMDLLQAQVKAEAESARTSVSADRRRLHDQRLRFDAECRAAEVRLSKRREALEVEKRALEEEADGAKEMHEVWYSPYTVGLISMPVSV